jgi:hypothetical protein
MQYNPSVNDNRGNIIANSADNVARTTLAGYQSMADGISQAGRSVAGGIMGYGQERARLEKESALIDGKTRAYAQMGVLSDADYAAMAKGNLAKKREILSQADAIYLDQVQRQNQGLQERKLDQDMQQLNRLHPEGWAGKVEHTTLPDGRLLLGMENAPGQRSWRVLDDPPVPQQLINQTTGQPVAGWLQVGKRLVNTNPNQSGYLGVFGNPPPGAATGGAPGAAPAQPKPPGTPADGDVIRARDKTGTMRTWRFNAKNPDQSTLIE